MEISLKTIIVFIAILTIGLSAGFFYGWQVSVIPGTKKVATSTYLEVMQSINREILNPQFFMIFFGCLILQIAASIVLKSTGAPFYFMVASTLTYLVGTFLVTAFGNVPLNNMLESIDLSTLPEIQLEELRSHFETKWNKLHTIRTYCSILSFVLAISASLFINK